jgi:hypothetical protein
MGAVVTGVFGADEAGVGNKARALMVVHRAEAVTVNLGARQKILSP